jgi:hypothetical protein
MLADSNDRIAVGRAVRWWFESRGIDNFSIGGMKGSSWLDQAGREAEVEHDSL